MFTAITSLHKRSLRLCLFAVPAVLIAATSCGGSSESVGAKPPDGGAEAGQGGEAGASSQPDGGAGAPSVMCPTIGL